MVRKIYKWNPFPLHLFGLKKPGISIRCFEKYSTSTSWFTKTCQNYPKRWIIKMKFTYGLSYKIQNFKSFSVNKILTACTVCVSKQLSFIIILNCDDLVDIWSYFTKWYSCNTFWSYYQFRTSRLGGINSWLKSSERY